MAVRNITKQLAGLEDLTLRGIGGASETQVRNGNLVPITKVDIPAIVDTIDDLMNVDITKFRSAIVREDDRGGTFIYDASQSAINNGGTLFNGWVRQYDGAINVKWFGLNSVDDTVAVQSAIDATPIGGILIIDTEVIIDGSANIATNTDQEGPTGGDDGTYGLLIDKSMTISGTGTIKLKSGIGSANLNCYIIQVDAEYVTIENITLDGNRDNVISSYGILVNSSYFILQKVLSFNLNGSLAIFNGHWNNIIKYARVLNCKTMGTGNNIFFTFSEKCHIENNIFTNGSEGIDLDKKCHNFNIIGNLFYNLANTDAAIECNGGSGHTISGNVIKNCRAGFIFNSKLINDSHLDTVNQTMDICQHITVTSNTVDDSISTHSFIIGNVTEDGTDVNHMIISNNTFKGGITTPLNIKGDNIILSGNIIEHTASSGVAILIEMGKKITIDNNIINSVVPSIYVTDCDNFRLIGNTIKGTATGDSSEILIVNSNSQIINNTIDSLLDYAIRTTGTQDLLLSNNVAKSNQYEYRFSGTTNVTIGGQNVGRVVDGTLNGNRIFFGTNTPSSSFTSYVGDIIYHTSPEAGGNIGWVCIESGAPGTWKAFGTIED